MKLLSLFVLYVVGIIGGMNVVQAKNTEPPRVTVITNHFVLSSKLTQLSAWGKAQNVTVTGYYIENTQYKVENQFKSDLVIIDTARGNDRKQVMEHIEEVLKSTKTPWIVVGGGRPLSGNLAPDLAQKLQAYYGAGGEVNFINMMRFIHAWHGGGDIASIDVAIPMPPTGFYHPDGQEYFENVSDYLAWGKKRWQKSGPKLAVAISQTYISNNQTKVIDALIYSVERAGGVPVVFWFNGREPKGMISKIGSVKPNMIVNMTHMFGGDIRKVEFLELNVPAVMGFIDRSRTVKEWREQPQGLAARATASMLSVPESWGMSDPLVLGAVEEGDPVPIPEQIDLMVGRLMATAKLQKKEREKRNVALLFWNS